MDQPVKLQLNAEALAALFPEGSQARLELQNAVVAEFVRKQLKEKVFGSDVFTTIDRVRAELKDELKRGREQVMTSALADAGLKKDSWGK